MTDETTWPSIGAFADSVDRALTEVRAVLTVEDYIAMGIDEESAAVMASQAAREAANPVVLAPVVTLADIEASVAARDADDCGLRGRWGCSLPAGHDGDCIKTCINHFWKRLGEGTESCPLEPALARYGHLCGPCFGRARHKLHETVDILAFIRSQVPPAMESARGPRVSGTREAPIPMNAQASDDSHDLFGQINYWMGNLAEALGIRPPLVTITFQRRTGESLPPFWGDPFGASVAMENIVDWYEGHERSIVRDLAPLTVLAWCGFIDDVVHEFRSRYRMAPTRPRRARPRVCPVCGEPTVTADFGRFSADVSCSHCGHVVPPAEQDAFVSWGESTNPPALSLACDRGRHNQCGWVDCPCTCHDHRAA